MDDDQESRTPVEDEIELLLAMYPDELLWNRTRAQLTFADERGRLDLRLHTDSTSSLPDVLGATVLPGQEDVRHIAKEIVSRQATGEPCLDAIINEFIEFLDSQHDKKVQAPTKSTSNPTNETKTVIVWLHHLLATGKRKLAISPTGPQASQVSGLTRPGYPGVMIFSGSAEAVEAHVQELKSQRWQAFQVRYEGDETWSFAHGHGIAEVESMGEMVAEVEGAGEQKNIFMQAMKIK